MLIEIILVETITSPILLIVVMVILTTIIKVPPLILKQCLKILLLHKLLFNKSVEEKFGKIDVLASKVDSLALDVDLIKLKVMPHDVNESKTLNSIQVRIDDNVRMMDELRARWEREDEMARKNNITKVCTSTTTSNAEVPSANKPPTINGKVVGVNIVSTPSVKRAKLPKITETVPDKSAELFRNTGDNGPITFDNNDIDFDDSDRKSVV